VLPPVNELVEIAFVEGEVVIASNDDAVFEASLPPQPSVERLHIAFAAHVGKLQLQQATGGICCAGVAFGQQPKKTHVSAVKQDVASGQRQTLVLRSIREAVRNAR
jgi:hypothetical protein